MKKYLFTISLVVLVVLGGAKVIAQTTEPGANLPLLPDDTSSEVATTTVTATTTSATYSTLATATASSAVTTSTTSAVSTTQTAVDDVETGSEVIFLSIFSITGGIGLFLIKKYFDLKRYSL